MNRDGGPPGLDYHNTDGNAGRLGRAPVPAAAQGPNPPDPPDDDDDGDEDDEEEPSDDDDDDDDHRRNRRSSRRRRSRDRRSHNNPRISRKEAEKVNVPPLPKITKLDGWKMALTMNVTSASADPDIEVWMSWLACAFVVNPDLGFLADSGGERFARMDIKLALSLQTMIRSAPDDEKDVAHDIQLHAERRQRENRIAIILQSFRSSDRSDMVFTIEHLIRLDYVGDKNMSVLCNKWCDILLNLRKEDTPREITLWDIPYHKIKGSRMLEFGLNTYARVPDTHPEKTYRFLLGLIDRQLRTDREDYVYDMKEKSAKNLLSSNKNAAPAEKKGKGKSGKEADHEDGNTAAPVLKRPRQEGQRKRKREKHEP